MDPERTCARSRCVARQRRADVAFSQHSHIRLTQQKRAVDAGIYGKPVLLQAGYVGSILRRLEREGSMRRREFLTAPSGVAATAAWPLNVLGEYLAV
jgi:hypothetical protein